MLTIEKNKKLMTLACFKADTSRLNEFIAPKKLRRIDHLSRIALLGAGLAIADSKLSPKELEDTGIILATGYGALNTGFSFLSSFLDKGDQLSKPTLFSNSVHNAAAAYISIFFGIKGPSLSVSQFDLSVPSALLTAMLWIKEGRADSVLVGGVDEYCDVLGYAGANLHAARNNKTLTLGEGGCFFVLSRAKDCNETGYARLANVDIFDQKKDPFSVENRLVIMGGQGYGGYGACACNDIALGPSGICQEALYGNFPCAAALDMGAACLGLKHATIFNRMTQRFPKKKNLDPNTILCVKPGNDSLWGKITLKSNKNESQ
jgi:3-oxoacyl-[acyl-carrier-protein] synthase II